MMRPISFEQAKARYPHRFTMEHVPAWALLRPCDHGGTMTKHYAPTHRTDREWYENTLFPGEGFVRKNEKHCFVVRHSFPMGLWLDQPFVRTR
jgi:hypothetical protein